MLLKIYKKIAGKKSLSRKGVSMIQVMMAAGIAGMVALISGQIITQQAKQNVMIKNRQRELELRRDVGEVLEMVKENSQLPNEPFHDALMKMNGRVQDCLQGLTASKIRTGPNTNDIDNCPSTWTPVRIPLPTAVLDEGPGDPDTNDYDVDLQVAGAYTNDMRKCNIAFLDSPTRYKVDQPDFSNWKCERDRASPSDGCDAGSPPLAGFDANGYDAAGQTCPIVVLTYWKHSCPDNTADGGNCNGEAECVQCTNLQFTYALMRFKEDGS